jgi:integrase
MRINLTDLAVKNLPTPQRAQHTYHDMTVPGFGVRVAPSGTKTFTLVHGPHRKRITLGRYPIVSLAKARKAALDILAEKQLGIHHEAPRTTFEEGYALFLKVYEAENRPKTVYEMKRLVRRHWMPAFRRYQLVDITTRDVASVVEALIATPSECEKAFVAARTVFRWLARRKLIKSSPLADLQPPTRSTSRDRVLSDAELAEVLQTAIDEDSIFGEIIQLLIITGQRKSQVAHLRGEYVDLDNSLITWPAAVMKKRAHSIPLTPMARSILPTGPAPIFLFPARGKASPFAGFSAAKAAFDKKLKHVQPWTIHDLRRTFSTGLARLRVPPHIKEMLLSHVSAKTPVEAIYDRYTYESEMREALEKWEAKLQALVSNTESKNGSELPGLRYERARAAE